MHVYGQLVHVEEFHIDSVHYRVAVFRVQGGLHGTWGCDGCQTKEDDGIHATIEECVAETKKLVREHHREQHGC